MNGGGTAAHAVAELALDSTNGGAGLAGLADALVQTLPTGSQVVVCWNDPRLGTGCSEVADVTQTLREHALASAQGQTSTPRDGCIDHGWQADGTGIAIVAALSEPLSSTSQKAWLALAMRMVDASLAAARAEARIESLRKSERLQQALYEIADVSGSSLEMAEVLTRIHAVVGTLMLAENFYIVLYDDARQTLRFLYFVDQRDPWIAEPELEIPAAEMPNSLTVALLRHGRPLLGPSTIIGERLQVDLDSNQGPDAEDWLGVPMRRDDHVSGAIVVQSYDQPAHYTEEDRTLLEYVAQHILIALDRKQAKTLLERRVDERTRELQQANLVMQAEVIERQRAEELQRALYRISELSVAAGSIEQFYADVHGVVGELLFAKNFYIAMVSADGAHLEFGYSVDEHDPVREPRRMGKGLSEYVINTAEALRANREAIARLHAAGKVRSQGSQAHSWLGVPLSRDGAAIGVLAVQSYSEDVVFTLRDQDLLTFVAHHIDNALARKRAQESLKAAHAELESRVESRTRELEHANQELRAQIGERVRAEQQLTYQTRHDPLTGLPNRIQLLERLDAAIAGMHVGGREPFAVLFLDLDRFKLVNDSVGHAAGDEMLVETGRRIDALLGDNDMVARLGGDEFAILVDAPSDALAAEALAGRILHALGAPLWVAGRELFPSASIGISAWQPHYRRGEDMLRDADAAMYRAKARGRDRSELFDDQMREEAMRLLDLEADLRRAILKDAFEPVFQPIVRLDNGAMVGHEALLRWHHEERGVLAPAEFIGVGEDSGLIEQVDWLLYRRVFDWMTRQPEGYVSINVSPRHLRSDDFAERLLRMVVDAGADPRRLRLEITEIALLDDPPQALRAFNALRDNGVLVMLDDFGTGFSALSYLHRFPIHALKIDRSFVAGLDGDMHAESLALVRAILALAGTLGIDAIAEGIETARQREILLQLGCAHGQGYFYGRPVSEAGLPGATAAG
jgi:diguanylate cyclase (GGDEF)-like protein